MENQENKLKFEDYADDELYHELSSSEDYAGDELYHEPSSSEEKNLYLELVSYHENARGLHPIDNAEALAKIKQANNLSLSELSCLVDLGRSTVSAKLGLNKLPDEIKTRARKIAGLSNKKLLSVKRAGSLALQHEMLDRIEREYNLNSCDVQESQNGDGVDRRTVTVETEKFIATLILECPKSLKYKYVVEKIVVNGNSELMMCLTKRLTSDIESPVLISLPNSDWVEIQLD